MRFPSALIVAPLCIVAAAQADTILVPGDHPTIQAAIDNALSDDVIEVSAGTYRENVVVPSDLRIEIRGVDGASSTIIDGLGVASAVTVSDSADVDLISFTITGGAAESGGGIHSMNATLRVSDAIIIANQAGSGGGAHVAGGSALFNGVIFDGNIAETDGGGLSSVDATVSVVDCSTTNSRAASGAGMAFAGGVVEVVATSISDNIATDNGGGIWFTGAIDPEIDRCTIIGNFCSANGAGVAHDGIGQLVTISSIIANNASTGGVGGGMWSTGAASIRCLNGTLWGNSAPSIGGIQSEQTTFIGNSVLWNNTDATGPTAAAQIGGPANVVYSDIQGGFAGTNNINQDPVFNAPSDNDFTFPNTSPLFDAGDTALVEQAGALDVAGNPRIADAEVDIGAVEFRRTEYFVPADFATIGEAIDFANDGETISVAFGQYEESLDFMGKAITLRGMSLRGKTLLPTIASPTSARTITCINPNGQALLADLMITGPNGTGGGGVHAEGNVLIVDCLIFGCESSGDGGGLLASGNVRLERTTLAQNLSDARGGGAFIEASADPDETVLFRDCAIISNSAENGGGVACAGNARFIATNIVQNSTLGTGSGGGVLNTDGDIEMINCRLLENDAGFGGGIFAAVGSHSTLIGNYIAQNTAIDGAGANIDVNTFVRMTNCSIVDNNASGIGGGLYATVQNSDALVVNSILWDNVGDEVFADYEGGGGRGGGDLVINNSCIRFGWSGTGTGNITDDPLFEDPEGDLYFLTATSPCIDIANMAALITTRDVDDLDQDGLFREYYPIDVNGLPRVRNGRADLGALEAFVGPSDSLWTGLGTAVWSDPMSWFPDAPGPNNNVLFRGDANLTLDAPATHTQVHFDNGVFNLDPNGNTLGFTADLLGPAISVGVWSDTTAELILSDGDLMTLGALPMQIGAMGVLSGNASIQADVDVAGEIRPGGDGFGSHFIFGDLSMTATDPLGVTEAGHAFFNMFTVSRGLILNDSVDVSGNLNLAGALTVEDDGMTTPVVGQSFQLIGCDGAVTGRFDVAFMPGLPAGRFYRVIYDNTGQRGQPGVYLLVDTLRGRPEFESSSDFELSGAGTDSAVGDLNGDGLPDLAITIPDASPANPGTLIVLFNGGVSGDDWNGFTSSAQYNVGRDPIAVDIGELDGSPGLDVAVLNRGDDSISILTNDGGGVLSGGTTIPAVIDDGRALIIVDVDGDDDDDIAATGLRIGVGRLVVIQNTSTRGVTSFGSPMYFEANDDPGDLDPADFDNDKDPDIVTTNRDGGAVSVQQNQSGGGNVSFKRSGDDIPVGGQPQASVAEDVDGDGMPDIITGNMEGESVTVILNRSDGDIEFAEPAEFDVGGPVRSIAAVDLDGDGPDGMGDVDVAAVVEDEMGNGDVKLLRNDTYGDQPVLTDDGKVESESNVLFVEKADVNDDGLADLVTVNDQVQSTRGGGPAGRAVRVLLNRGGICAGDLTGDGMVGMNDLNEILDNWSQSVVPGFDGDANFDGVVNFIDLELVLDEWASACE